LKQLVVLSGKGGTGKTTVTASLAVLAARDLDLVLVDADCEAANLGLLLEPELLEREEFHGGETASIDAGLCSACGLCRELCRFDAVKLSDGAYSIEASSCEGCRACFYACPEEAIAMSPRLSGHLTLSRTDHGPLHDARLLPAGENSGKTVSELRGRAQAAAGDGTLILIDGPPGIGCPAIAASRGCDLALLVAEPTLSSLSDMERSLEAARHFGVPARVFLNKADLNSRVAQQLREACAARDIPVIGELPFSSEVQLAVEAGRPLPLSASPDLTESLTRCWAELREVLGL